MTSAMRRWIGTDRPLGDMIARGRANNFNLLRLAAAFAVLFSHSFVLVSGVETLETVDPISWFLIQYSGFGESFGDLAVDVFFVISGFLVARSYLTQKTVISFIEARILRLFPAAILCAVVMVIALASLSALPVGDYFADRQTWQFFVANSTLWKVQFDLPGVFTDNSYAGAVNGSLWTLPIELRAYIFLTLIGVTGVLRRRSTTNLILLVLVILFLVPEWSSIVTRSEDKWRLYLFFMVGAAFYVNRQHIPVGLLPPLALLALYVATAPFAKLHALIFVFLVSYVTLALALARYVPSLDPGRFGDFSYGVYLYAFPVQQSLLHFLPMYLNGWWLTLWATIFTLLFAVISWFLVEQHALRQKGVTAAAWARYRG